MNQFQNDEKGAPAYHPEDTLKVIFLAFLRGIYFTRKKKRLCQENRVFMALIGDYQPDPATIARFILRLEPHLASAAVGSQNEGQYLKGMVIPSKKA